MSGIAAIINNSGKPINETLIRNMTAMMAIRGPDAQTYHMEKNIALANTLLRSTFEAENEQQPSTIDGGTWITADVRIDDREALIRKISAKINLPLQLTDDQIILYAYKLWGVQCLQHMIGDFAFILWDAIEETLLCASDHFGVCPLYYAETNDGLCLSNTLNVIRLHPDISDDLDDLAIADYLLFRINENPEGTIFKDIKKVPSSHMLIYSKGKLKIQSYWSLSSNTDIQYRRPEEYIEEFNHVLSLAVSDRLRTDNAGCHMSGGMDSPSIAAIAHRHLTKHYDTFNFKSYTFGASSSLADLESPLAKQTAERLGIPNHIYHSQESHHMVEEVPSELFPPEPSFMQRDFTRYHLLSDISEYGRVLFTGFGGDPLLTPRSLQPSDFNSLTKLKSLSSQAMLHYKACGSIPRLGIRANLRRRKRFSGADMMLPEWINPEFALKQNLADRMIDIKIRKSHANNSRSGMLTEGLWRRIFCWNDPGFSHIPVKVRHPFFDIRLMELAQSLPPFPWLQNKYILRQAMTNQLPQAITQRPKTPLPGNPFGTQLKDNGVSEELFKLLKNSVLSDYINTNTLSQQLESVQNCQSKDFRDIMRITSLSYWLQEHTTALRNTQKGLQHDNIRKI